MRPIVVAIMFVLFGLVVVGAHRAIADTGSGSAVVLVGSGSSVAPPTAATLHDPTTDPLGAIADVRGLKARWPLLVLAILIALTKALTFAGGKLAPLGKWLATGKHAMWVAVAGGLAATAFDSLAAGGTWMTAALALGVSVVALLSPHAPVTAQAKAGA